MRRFLTFKTSLIEALFLPSPAGKLPLLIANTQVARTAPTRLSGCANGLFGGGRGGGKPVQARFGFHCFPTTRHPNGDQEGQSWRPSVRQVSGFAKVGPAGSGRQIPSSLRQCHEGALRAFARLRSLDHSFRWSRCICRPCVTFSSTSEGKVATAIE